MNYKLKFKIIIFGLGSKLKFNPNINQNVANKYYPINTRESQKTPKCVHIKNRLILLLFFLFNDLDKRIINIRHFADF